MAETWLTREELQKRQEHLVYLKGARRLEIAEMLKVARAFGDLSENAEYDAAKNEQAQNEYEIQHLEAELHDAKIIGDEVGEIGAIFVGSTVTIKMPGTKTEMTYQIVGTAEANPSGGRISNESPIGKALIGHKAGETVEAVTPSGILRIKIVSMES